MKQKIRSVFSILLAILLAISMVSCNLDFSDLQNEPTCAHRWSNANCTHPKTCYLCNVTEGTVSAGDHAYVMGDDDYVCLYCGESAPELVKACTHVSGKDTCPLCGMTARNVIKNVIYIIGDGMGLEHIAAGQLAYETDYAFEEWQFASVNTDSLTSGGRNQSELTDSAAAGTALATGVVTLNGYVGKDQNGNDLSTVLDYAKQKGKLTGVISTDYLYGATPAAFSAHSTDRDDYLTILTSQITSNVDLLCGQTSTSQALSDTVITQNGYRAYTSLDEIRAHAPGSGKLYCTLDMEETSLTEAPVKLSDVATAALNALDSENGFVLMIEQAHIDKASHNNQFEQMAQAVNSLNDTVNAILAWLGDRTDTAIVLTADHETGDLSVSGSKTLPYSATLPNHTTVYYRFNSTSHTKANVGLFLYGADVQIERISYFKTPYTVKNSDICNIVKRLINDQR